MITPRIAILANYPVWLLEDSPVPPFKGHYATWLTALAEAFGQQADFEVHWVTLSKALREPVCLERMGQHFHILPRASRTIGLYTFYLHDRRLIARELRRIRPVLVHSWGNEDCYALCGRDFKGHKLLSVQGALRTCVRTGTMASFMRCQSWYEPLTVAAHPWVTTESPWAEQCIRKLSSKPRFFHLEYAVERRFFGVERVLNMSPRCLFAGSDIPLKNVDLLIRAFSRPELSHLELRLAGVDAASRPNLPPNITCLGRIDRDAMVRELASTWCLVHPSLADTGPTVVKEARVMGIPVILTDCCGSQQHVVEGQSGFIHAAHDDEGFARSVLTVTNDAETSLRMGAYGREECRHALSEELMYSTLTNIYRTILQA